MAPLMQWGPLQFEVYPLNFHEMDQATQSDWARKEIAGAPLHYEYVGEGAEEVYLRGRVFPHKLGGLTELETFEAMRREAQVHQMVRGDGRVLGWFACEKLIRQGQFIAADGVAQQISFEAVFVRMPIPDPADYFPWLYRLVQ